MEKNIGKYKEKEKLDRKVLLRELALDISRKYGLAVEKTEKLIKAETLNSIEDLKSEIENNEILKKLEKKELEKLFFTLKGALEVIENISKLEIEVLKKEIEDNVNIEDFKNHLEDYLPKELVEKAKNPKLLHEHILGVALGSANSIFKTTEVLYKIGIGIIKFPYHLYLIITKKAKIKNIDKI